MTDYSIKVPIDKMAVVTPLSISDGDNFTLRFLDRDAVVDTIEKLENLLLAIAEEDNV